MAEFSGSNGLILNKSGCLAHAKAHRLGLPEGFNILMWPKECYAIDLRLALLGIAVMVSLLYSGVAFSTAKTLLSVFTWVSTKEDLGRLNARSDSAVSITWSDQPPSLRSKRAHSFHFSGFGLFSDLQALLALLTIQKLCVLGTIPWVTQTEEKPFLAVSTASHYFSQV